MAATSNVLILITKESKYDLGTVELPIESNDIQSVGCGAECISLITTEGKVFSNTIKDCNLTNWKRPSGLAQHSVYQVASGLSHHVALTTDNKVMTWGKNDKGQLGRQTTSSKSTKGRKTKISFFNASLLTSIQSLNVLMVSCGDSHTLCLTEEGHVYSWGDNASGQLGRNSVSTPIPQIIPALENIHIVQISSGGSHNFAISVSRQTYSWGSNCYGQLGLTTESTKQPLPVLCHDLSGRKSHSIHCGENHTAVLTLEGFVLTCGLGSSGQLGHDGIENEFQPRQIKHLMDVSQVACGRNHTVAWMKSTNVLHIFGFENDESIDLPNHHMTTTLACGGMCSFVYQSSPNDIESIEEDAISRLDSSHLLTLDSALHVMNQNKDTEMECMLQKALSNASCINGSFLISEYDHHAFSESKQNIDLEKAENFFKRLRSAYFFDITTKALKKMLKNLENRPSYGMDMLRVFLLLPCCLYGRNNVYDDDIASSLAGQILRLSQEDKILLGKWLKSVSSKFFKRYIWFFKTCVMKVFKRIKRNHNGSDVSGIAGDFTKVKSCVEVMDMVNEINLCRDQPVKIEKFYLNDLIDLINIQGDFVGFKQDQQACMESKFRFCKYPFLYNSASKFQLLRCQCEEIMQLIQQNFLLLNIWRNPMHIELPKLEVRRDHLIEDTRKIIAMNAEILKLKLNVTFKNEISYTGDGIRQEFFVEMFKELLDPKFGVFYEEEDSNCQWFIQGSNLDHVHFIGLMCGVALYNGVTLNLQFPPALYKKLLKKPVTFQDLFQLKPVNYRSLMEMVKYTEDDMEDVFCVNFTTAHTKTLQESSETESVELCENGEDVPVTQANKEEYVKKVKEYYLNTSIEKEFQRFYDGLYAGIKEDLLRFFQPQELEAVLVGNERYDFEAFEKVTEYKGNYSRNHETIKFFWEVFHEMELDVQKAFLRFLTGTDRIPVYGIKRLKMTIWPRDDEGIAPDGMLPLAMTCTNSLMLPRYTNSASLERKILLAARSYKGFGHFSH